MLAGPRALARSRWLSRRRGPGDAGHRTCASLRRLLALHPEVLAKEGPMRILVVEMVRGEHHREDRPLGGQLHLHEGVDDRAGDELVPIDAAVDHEGRADAGGVAAGDRTSTRLNSSH